MNGVTHLCDKYYEKSSKRLILLEIHREIGIKIYAKRKNWIYRWWEDGRGAL